MSELHLPLGIQGDEGWRQEAGGCRLKAGGWPQNKPRTSPEAAAWKLETGGWRWRLELEARGWRVEAGGWRLEVGG